VTRGETFFQDMTAAQSGVPPINFRSRFPALDGIRALAAIMVFAFHYGGGAQGGILMRAFNAARLQGWAGVDIFFVLSGFLITGILYDTRNDSGYFRRFYARRCLRIFPAYYLVAALLLVLTPVFLYQWHTAHLLFLVYLGNIPAALSPSLYQLRARDPSADVYLGHLWSLCVEEQFYLLWPLLVWMLRDRLKLIWAATGLSVAALMLRCWMVFGGANLRGGWLLRMLPFHMDALLIGAVLALILRGPAAERWQRLCRWLLLAAAGILTALFLFDRAQYDLWMQTIGFTLIALASAGLIGWVLSPASAVSRALALKPLRVMGRYSYGFYIYHVLFAAAWAALTAWLAGRLHSRPLASATVLVVNFTVTFLVAKASYDLFESRFLLKRTAFAYDSEQLP
jgi:peptidoglycan/LPS O-acetylase OafA/YrhL